jgi:Leucine Rich repeat
MESIVKINLKNCGITYESIDQIFHQMALVNKTQLKSLNLSGNKLNGVLNMGLFLSKSTIEVLKLSSCKLGDNELKQLSHGLKNNRFLRIIDIS